MKRKTLYGFLFAVIAALVFSISYFMIEEQSMLFGLKTISVEDMNKLDIDENTIENRIDVLFNGKRIPYDKYSNTYYLYQPTKNSFTGSLEIEDDSYKIYICDNEKELFFIFTKAGKHKKSKLLVTTIPVLEINVVSPDGSSVEVGTNAKIESREEMLTSEFTLFSNIESSETSKMYQDGFLSIKLRGATSSQFEKKSYRIEIKNNNGNKKNESFLGMRSDDDWILNPLYTDQSMMRERVAYQVWDMMNESDSSVSEPASRIEYIELLINGEYRGVYGLQERIDAKQLGLDKDYDYLYKCVGWVIPTNEEFEKAKYETEVPSFMIESLPSATQENNWEYLNKYLNLFYRTNELSETSIKGISELVNIDNLIDYYIFTQILGAYDNGVKNTYYFADVSNKGMIVRVPWDLNYVLGDTYTESNYFATKEVPRWCSNPHYGDREFDYLMLNYPQYITPIFVERWELMKESVFNRKNVHNLIQENYTYLYESGAYDRNSERWPECVAENVSTMEDEFLMSIESFDNYVNSFQIS